MNRNPMEVQAFKLILNFWIKILEQDENSLSADAYKLLYEDAEKGIENWALFIKTKLNKLGFGFLWINQDPSLMNHYKSMVLKRMIDQYKQLDASKIDKIDYFKDMHPIENEDLSKLKIPFKLYKFLVQIRILGAPLIKYPLKQKECQLCNKESNVNEDLFHLCLICPHFSEIRNQMDFKKLRLPQNRYIFNLYFCNPSEKLIISFWSIFRKLEFRRSKLLEIME